MMKSDKKIRLRSPDGLINVFGRIIRGRNIIFTLASSLIVYTIKCYAFTLCEYTHYIDVPWISMSLVVPEAAPRTAYEAGKTMQGRSDHV